MGNYIIFGGFENPRRGGQARNLTTNAPKVLYLKSSSEQIFSKNCRWVPLRFIKARGNERLIMRIMEQIISTFCSWDISLSIMTLRILASAHTNDVFRKKLINKS